MIPISRRGVIQRYRAARVVRCVTIFDWDSHRDVHQLRCSVDVVYVCVPQIPAQSFAFSAGPGDPTHYPVAIFEPLSTDPATTQRMPFPGDKIPIDPA